jgi:hypothetical protein
MVCRVIWCENRAIFVVGALLYPEVRRVAAPAVDVGYVARVFRRASLLSAVRVLPAVDGPDQCRLEVVAIVCFQAVRGVSNRQCVD